MVVSVAGVTREVKAARDRLPDRVAVGVLTRTFPPESVDEAIEGAGARELRRRALPARMTAYFTLGMWLWPEHGYEEVLRQMTDGLSWAGLDGEAGDEVGDVPWSGSIAKARARLGPEPLRAMFSQVAGPVGAKETPGVFWRGLRLTAVDGSTLDVPDSDKNRDVFGGPSNAGGDGPFPQVRLVTHAECGTRALIGAVFDGYEVSEIELTRRLLPSFGEDMLVLADRNFPGYELWRDAAATGAHLLWRMSAAFTLPVLERLPDGTYLSALKPPRKSGGPPIPVRVIEYTVTTVGQDGTEAVSELFCLATTLLDPVKWPVEEIPDLYPERWNNETLLDAVKTDLRGGADVVLRSQSPDGVRQETWALLCVYQALSQLRTDAAAHHKVDPDRISFTRVRNAARRSVSKIGAAFPPSPP